MTVKCGNIECWKNDVMLPNGCQDWNIMRTQSCGFIEFKPKSKRITTNSINKALNKVFGEDLSIHRDRGNILFCGDLTLNWEETDVYAPSLSFFSIERWIEIAKGRMNQYNPV